MEECRNFGQTYNLCLSFHEKPEKGAETIIYLASSEEVANITGRYFFDKKEERSSEISYDRESAKNFGNLAKN